MRKEVNNNVFNILYWNIHYFDGSPIVTREKLKNATNIVVEQLDENIDNKKINIIVLTEAYPQINSFIGNNDILTHYMDRFDVFPYEPSEEYINKKFKANYYFAKPTFYNSVIVMTKKELRFDKETLKCISVSPNALYIANNNVQIIGIRFCIDNTVNIIEQIKRIKEN